MTARQRFGLSAMLAAFLLPAVGCIHNPSEFPYWWPTGEITPTHAKPGGPGELANFDPHAVQLEVRPLRTSNPVGTQHLVIATVLDEKGNAVRHRRVEWMLEGVGTIVEVDEAGLLAGRGYKVDNKYAVTYTDLFEHTITRGKSEPSLDTVVRPGQTWCVVSSPVEGETRLTAYAPEIYNWDHRTVSVAVQWVDCRWQFPAAATARSGAPHMLTTHLLRHSDQTPVSNYRIRYTLLEGGPQAELLPAHGRDATVASDESGNASIEIQQLNLQPGINRIGVEVIRPADPLNPGSSPIVLASQETTVDWQAPQIQVNINAPAAAAANQEFPATITVSNIGQVDTQAGTVSMQVPAGVSFVRSDPPARLDPRTNALVWEFGQLGGGRDQIVNLTLRSRDKGTYQASVVAMTRDSLKAEQGATFRVDTGGLKVSFSGPDSSAVGSPVDYMIQVSNPSSAEVSKVMVDLFLDQGLIAVTPNGTRLETKLQNDQITSLKPGETRSLPIRFDATKAGRLKCHVMVSADGGVSDEKDLLIDFNQAQVDFTQTGPKQVYLNRDGTWTLDVKNSGNVTITNAVLRDRLPPELTFRSATNGGTLNSQTNEIVWNLGNLAGGEERIVRFTAGASRPHTQAALSASVTAWPNVQKSADLPLDILGVSALTLDVASSANPITVGQQVTYTIRVGNRGTLPADQINVAAELPPMMRPLSAHGPQSGSWKGNTATFGAISNLQPNQMVTLTVTAQALSEGDARCRVTVQSPASAQPIVNEEATQIMPAANAGGVPR